MRHQARRNVLGMEHELISLNEAQARGLTYYFTGKPCKRGHVAQRFVSTRTCCACNRIANLVEDMTPEQLERKRAARRKENMTREAYARAQEGVARNDLFRAGRVGQSRLLPWYDRDATVTFYLLSEQLTRESGVVHHVDHIVALACKEASGLHVQTNLRVIPGAENVSKLAKLDHALATDPNPPQCTLESCRCGARSKLFTALLAA